jgi:hypothetical protein
MNPEREDLARAADADLETEEVALAHASDDEVLREKFGPEGRLLQLAGCRLREDGPKGEAAIRAAGRCRMVRLPP